MDDAPQTDDTPHAEGRGRAARSRTSVTIVDVADKAGVSIKSVSRVLNGEKYVRAEMRERIQAAIDALGFVPKLGARSLRGKHFVLGLLFDTSKGQYLLEIQNAAMKSCREARHHLIVESLSPDIVNDPDALAAQLHGLQVDGVAVLPPLCDNVILLNELEAQRIPYTRIAPTIALGRSSAVVVDDDAAVREMVRYLWDLGHRRIGFITGSVAHRSAHRRRDAFVSELTTLAGAVPDKLVEQGDFSFDSGLAVGTRLIELDERPTAIFASNDEMAAGVIAAAMTKGLRLPGDLSICGFDDSPIARLTWPPLTTICQPLNKMASAAFAHLLNDPGSHSLQRLDLKLIVRMSTAPLLRG